MLDIQYYKHALWVNDNVDSAFIGVITLWTPKSDVLELIDETNKSKVLTIGNLYTLQGLEWIIRNVCANPIYETLVVVGNDRNYIKPLLMKGNTNIMSEYGDCEQRFWDYFKSNIVFVDSIDELNDVISGLKRKGDWIPEPIMIPKPIKPDFATYESEGTGFIVRDSDLYQLWQRALLHIKMFGVSVNGTREILNLMSVLTKKPMLNDEFPAVEQASQYIDQICTNKGTDGVAYTYGQRIFGRNQIDEIVDSLCSNVWQRNAVATTWEPPNDYHIQPPCLVLVTFRIHPSNDDKHKYIMYMNTVFRSHDIYKAYPMNLWGLWQLGELVLERIVERTGYDITLSSLTNLSISAHVYNDDLKLLRQVRYVNCNLDTRGYFVITVDREKHLICVTLMNSNNEFVNSWQSISVHELCDRCQLFIADVSHALYMGRELSRAYQCLVDGTEYVQQ